MGWINNEGLLYSTRNYIQYHVLNHNGKEYETKNKKEGKTVPFTHPCMTEGKRSCPTVNTSHCKHN